MMNPRRSAGLGNSGDNFICDIGYGHVNIYSVILLHKLLQIRHYNLVISSVIQFSVPGVNRVMH